MGLEEGIRKRGFRKWYERELVQSHAHLVLTFVCAVGLMASFELHDRLAPWSVQLWNAGAIVLLALVGLWSLRRYLYLLMHAEEMANQANCGQCKAYGLLLGYGSLRPGGVVRRRGRVLGHRCAEVDAVSWVRYAS